MRYSPSGFDSLSGFRDTTGLGFLFMKVLVVHRQESILQSIKEQMKSWYIKSFTSGLDGLIASKLENFDLILCAQNLPVVTGIELVRSIRNLSMNTHTPVILLAEGNETPEHERIMSILHANLMTLDEVEEMKNLQLE
jgi:CheY-like chemotaxis protein